MAEPFLSEFRMFSFQFAPRGWALCNGQLLPINQNQGLFSLLGTTFGGDGRVNFALPDLRGRVPVHAGSEVSLGQRGGEQAVTLSLSELPAHGHAVRVHSGVSTERSPAGKTWARTSENMFRPDANAGMSGSQVSNVGGSQAHTNMQPSLVISFCVALQGIFPSPN